MSLSTTDALTLAPADWRLALPEARRKRLRIWMWMLAAMTAAVLVVGGITRLTHSGLSMVEWQPLIGVIPPLGQAQWEDRFEQYRRFPEYQQLRQGMTLQEFKIIFLWEYLHRLLARAIGLAFVIPFIVFWRDGSLTSAVARRACVILGVGAAQGAMGWFMVRSGLVDRPSVSHYRLAAHLALAFIIFVLCVWLARDLSVGRRRTVVASRVRRLMARGLGVLGALIAAQIVWGAFVAGLKAGLMFNTFPLMDGYLVPPGLLAFDPPLLNLIQNGLTVQWVHRVLGTTLLVATAVVFLRIRLAAADPLSERLNVMLVSAVTTQYFFGVATLVLAVPVGLAALHQTTALVIAGIWTVWVHHVRALES